MSDSIIYKVHSRRPISPAHPLHVSRFYRCDRVHGHMLQDRQDLIVYLAGLHASAVRFCRRRGLPLGLCHIKMRLSSLRDWVYNYRPVLDHFFEVKERGFRLADGTAEVSLLVPRALPGDQEDIEPGEYLVPPRPPGVQSKVYVQRHRAEAIRERLLSEARYELLAPVNWLLDRPEVNFIFRPAGRLQLRDTSVWPVAAIETWPGWLREELFGPGIDIESAYAQFLVEQLRQIYAGRDDALELLYPHLLAQVRDKHQWRIRLCSDVLGLHPGPEALDLVKKICMSLANGSRISPAILLGGGPFSSTAGAIIEKIGDLSPDRCNLIGTELRRIAGEYSLAKKTICARQLRLNPSKSNQRRVFTSYFEWERKVRYLLWESIDRHGIMVHDGIDGVPARYLDQLPSIMEKIGVKIGA